MIIETIILVGGAVILASLGFADRVLNRQAQEDKPLSSGNIEKQKEILERQRAVWLKVAQAPCTTPERQGYLDKAAEIDKQLLKLAQEENR